ncbi:HDOD domain-containing protein [Pseudomonas syringae pv. actinidiae]|nr:HDOD domain-containing protein [Pseudomonas syringae pv. actinidiae]
MSDIKFHWFKDSSKNSLYAVAASNSCVISPVLLREHFKFDALYSHALHDMASRASVPMQLNLLVDENVNLPDELRSILSCLDDSIAEKIGEIVFLGHHRVAEKADEVSSFEDHDFLRRRLNLMMNNLNGLAPMDSTGRKLLMLKGRRHLMDRDFFTVIENDAALSAQLMNWSCSSIYGNLNPAKNIQDAVRRSLGVEQALLLSIGLSIQKSFKIEKQLKVHLNDYIRRSIYVAAVSSKISLITPVSHDSETIYLCGMLHNLGELILMQISPGLYRMYAAYMTVNPGHYDGYVQQHVLKMSCAEIGAALGEQWELPAKIIHVIRHGRPQDITPQDTGEDRIVALAQGMLSRQSFVKGNSEISYREEKYRLCLSSDSIAEVGEMFDSQKSYLDSIITSIAC